MAHSLAATRGLTLAPLFVRLGLALVFIFAGWNKAVGHFNVKGEDAAILANLGILKPPTPAAAAPPFPQAVPPAQPTTYSAADFRDEVPVRGAWGIALLLYKAGHPAPRADGAAPTPIWPPALAEGTFPRVFAVAVTAAELLGGILALLGWFGRFAGLALAGVMLGAMWLSQIGPNWQSGNVVFGFIPAYPAGDPSLWTPLLFQITLLCGALSLAIGGSGRPAVDWALRAAREADASPRPVARPAPESDA